MATRFNAKPRTNYGIEPLPSGYPTGATSDLTIPSVGIEDVDAGVFNLFDKEIPLMVGGPDADLKKVPVIFAGGEKWAMIKRNRSLRDKNGTLMLPLLAVGRTNIKQDYTEDITGRGINQRVGEIVVRRRLDKSDRSYQNLVNKIILDRQRASSVPHVDIADGQLASDRKLGELAEDGTVADGGLLVSNRMNNVFETIVVPTPQFVTIDYDVLMWTQYTHHMNQMIETLVSSFLPQTQGWRIDTQKGYWFVAELSDQSFSADTNFDDMSGAERIIKYKFSFKVAAYIFASSAPGVPIPVKRYISAPIIKFDVGLPMDTDVEPNTHDDPMLGADDPTLPLANGYVKNVDQRRTGRGKIYTGTEVIDPNDPALENRPRGRKLPKYKKVTVKNSKGQVANRLVRVTATNPATGETSFASSDDIDALSITVIED